MARPQPHIVRIDVRGDPNAAFQEALGRYAPELRFGYFPADARGEAGETSGNPPPAFLGCFLVSRDNLRDFAEQIRPLAEEMIDDPVSFQARWRVLDLRQDAVAAEREILDSYAEDEDVVCFADGPAPVCAPEELDAVAAGAGGLGDDDADLAQFDERVVT